MAATLPVENDVSSYKGERKRKQWSVQAGGPKGLLRRMRSQLAEDGCPESQLVMGRTLLDQLTQGGGETEEEGGGGGGGGEGSGFEEEARLAVFWLTRASNQGSVEATHLLQHCLDTNTGICEHNYHEVRESLAMELQEKLARRAGRLLFASISDGNELVSSSSLARRIQEVVGGEVAAPCPDPNAQDNQPAPTAPTGPTDPKTPSTASLEELYGGERYSEDHIISAAVLHHYGCIPPLHHLLALPLTPPHLRSPSTLHSLTHKPLKILRDVYDAFLQFFAVSLVCFARRFGVLVSVLCVLVLSVVFYLFGARLEVLSGVLPGLVLCLGFVVMVASSSSILLNGKKLASHQMWSKVFVYFCGDLDVSISERRFRAQCWRPYVIFFLSVCVYVSALPLVGNTLIVACLPILCLFSLFMFFAAVDSFASWHLISLALYLLAVNPGVVDFCGVGGVVISALGVAGWVSQGSFQVWGGINFNFGAGTFIHLLWVVALVCVGLRRATSIPPHLAGLAWVHLAALGCGKVSATQEVVLPIAVSLVVFLIPAAGSVNVLCLPAIICTAAYKLGASQEILAVIFILCGCGVFVSTRVWPRFTTAVLKLAVVCAVVITLLQSNTVSVATPKHSTLQWDVYKNACVAKTTHAENIRTCAPLVGTAVKWRGTVLQVEVTETTNIPLKIISFVPPFLERHLKCFLGRRLPQCNSKDVAAQSRCLAIRGALGGSPCSLDNWNQYKFAVSLVMQESIWNSGNAEVSLLAGDPFADFMLGLKGGEVVEFTGTMVGGVGTHHLSLSLSGIKCVSCKLKDSPEVLISSGEDLKVAEFLLRGVRRVFNFVFSPTLSL